MYLYVTYLVLNSNPLDNFEESTAKTTTIVGGVHLGEAEEGTLVLPVVWRYFFVPVASYAEICVLVLCLPRITREGYKTSFARLKNSLGKLDIGRWVAYF
jgi:hypothetical protein